MSSNTVRNYNFYVPAFGVVLLCLLWASPFIGVSQILHDTTFGNHAEKGLKQLYRMEFGAAHATFSKLAITYPRHPAPHLLSGLTYTWQISLDERDTRYDAQLNREIETAFSLNKQLKPLPDAQAEYTLCELGALTLRSRQQAVRSNWAGSVNTARKCLSLLNDHPELHQETPEFLYFQGSYNYFVDAYPAKYPLIKPFFVFFPDGNIRQGLTELKASAETRLITQGEAAYQLALILLDYERDYPKALKVSRKLYQRFPQNSMFSFLYGVALYQNKKYPEAEQVLGKLEQRYEKIPGAADTRISAETSTVTSRLMMEVYYYRGLVQMIEYKDEPNAVQKFQASRKMARLCDFQDHDLYVGAMYHIAVCYDRMEQRETALEIYAQVIKEDKSGGYKPRAKKCLETPCKEHF